MEGSLLLRFVTPMNTSLVIMEGSLLLRFVIPMNGSLVIIEGRLCLIFDAPMNGSLVIMEGSLLSRVLLSQWIVTLSLWKVVLCRDFCYSNVK